MMQPSRFSTFNFILSWLFIFGAVSCKDETSEIIKTYAIPKLNIKNVSSRHATILIDNVQLGNQIPESINLQYSPNASFDNFKEIPVNYEVVDDIIKFPRMRVKDLNPESTYTFKLKISYSDSIQYSNLAQEYTNSLEKYATYDYTDLSLFTYSHPGLVNNFPYKNNGKGLFHLFSYENSFIGEYNVETDDWNTTEISNNSLEFLLRTHLNVLQIKVNDNIIFGFGIGLSDESLNTTFYEYDINNGITESTFEYNESVPTSYFNAPFDQKNFLFTTLENNTISTLLFDEINKKWDKQTELEQSGGHILLSFEKNSNLYLMTRKNSTEQYLFKYDPINNTMIEEGFGSYLIQSGIGAYTYYNDMIYYRSGSKLCVFDKNKLESAIVGELSGGALFIIDDVVYANSGFDINVLELK